MSRIDHRDNAEQALQKVTDLATSGVLGTEALATITAQAACAHATLALLDVLEGRKRHPAGRKRNPEPKPAPTYAPTPTPTPVDHVPALAVLRPNGGH